MKTIIIACNDDVVDVLSQRCARDHASAFDDFASIVDTDDWLLSQRDGV